MPPWVFVAQKLLRAGFLSQQKGVGRMPPSGKQKHTLPLRDAARMDWRNAVVLVDRRCNDRREYFRV
jgi:hypothetical protein